MNQRGTKIRAREREELLRYHADHRDAIRKRLSEFRSVPSTEYFYELAYCLLTPQSSAVHADAAIVHLRNENFLLHNVDPEPILRSKTNYIRFHKTKSRRLLRVKTQLPEISRTLAEALPAGELREWLVNSVVGFGYKEATHFLRNIGRNDGLTILDRHILRNLRRRGVIRTIPKSMTKKNYLRIERRFIAYAKTLGIPVDELDLVFWSLETGEIRK